MAHFHNSVVIESKRLIERTKEKGPLPVYPAEKLCVLGPVCGRGRQRLAAAPPQWRRSGVHSMAHWHLTTSIRLQHGYYDMPFQPPTTLTGRDQGTLANVPYTGKSTRRNLRPALPPHLTQIEVSEAFVHEGTFFFLIFALMDVNVCSDTCLLWPFSFKDR